MKKDRKPMRISASRDVVLSEKDIYNLQNRIETDTVEELPEHLQYVAIALIRRGNPMLDLAIIHNLMVSECEIDDFEPWEPITDPNFGLSERPIIKLSTKSFGV